MSTPLGTAVNFAFTQSASGTQGVVFTSGVTNMTGFILQNADTSAEADKEEARSIGGDVISRNWYDQHRKGTLEFVISGATNSIAAALANTTLAKFTPGSIITITECLSMPELVTLNGGIWEVQPGASIKGSNTNAKRLSVPLETRPGIQASQPA
jgi:hypothetical protein